MNLQPILWWRFIFLGIFFSLFRLSSFAKMSYTKEKCKDILIFPPTWLPTQTLYLSMVIGSKYILYHVRHLFMIESDNPMNNIYMLDLKFTSVQTLKNVIVTFFDRKTSLVGQETWFSNRKINKKVTFADSRTLNESQRNGLRHVVSMKTSLKVGVPS